MGKIRRQRRGVAALAMLITFGLLTAACGGDGDDSAAEPAADESTDASTDDSADESTDDSADDSADEPAADGVPTSELCGTDPIRIAHIDGFGSNAWRKITAAELLDEVSVCDNVEVTYSQADGDLQAYITAVNSSVAQGFDAIVTFDDFGSQALDSLRAAHDAGVVVVTYIADPGGENGTDYTYFLPQGTPEAAAAWADWLDGLLGGEGDLIFVGGIPGNPSSLGAMGGFETRAEELGGGLAFLNDEPIDTNWDPAEEQRVMAGVLTQYESFDAVVSDYGVASVGGIRAFINAGRPIPPLATYASSNELGCIWEELRPDNPDFEVLAYEGTTRVVRGAVRRALGAINGVETGDPEVYPLIKFMDTLAGMDPPCDPELPPDADLSSALPPETLASLFE